jgi:hypothetical protein
MEFKVFRKEVLEIFRYLSRGFYLQNSFFLLQFWPACLAKSGLYKDLCNILPGPCSEQFDL